jgi:exonuclease SbcD
MRILHFADAHIDMANYGRQDAETGLPIRVMDYLKSMDEIVDTAIKEKVDLVLFAGDAYKDRNPAPTFTREWGRRIMRLSRAGIPTLLLVGNHDLSPSLGRAHAMEEYATLEVPNVKVLSEPAFLGPSDLWGLPLQVIAVPWITRSGMMAFLDLQSGEVEDVYELLEQKLTELVQDYLKQADHNLPIVLAAHASVQGASYGNEQTVMLGNDLQLSGSLVKDSRLDYVALGHIHKAQDLNEDGQPHVIYPGSIERVDFGEVNDDKFFVIVDIKKGASVPDWRQLRGVRKFVTAYWPPRRAGDAAAFKAEDQLNVTGSILAELAKKGDLTDAIVRLIIEYPREWESLIDESSIRAAAADTFEFHLVKHPQVGARGRIANEAVGEMSPYKLLDIYWGSVHIDEAADRNELNRLAKDVIEAPLEEEQ